MLARSSKFDAAVRTSHSPIGYVDLFDASGRPLQRRIPVLPGGGVTADRLSGTLRVSDVVVPRAVLSENTMRHLTEYPGDVYVQRWRGVRHQATAMRGGVHDSAATWTPDGSSPYEEMASLVVDGDGSLTLADP